MAPGTPASAGWSRETGPLNISRRNGQGKPIVLLHGFTADSQSWAPLEKALGASAPLLRIDLPGHGKSPKRQVNSFQDLSRMVVEAFDEATRDSEGVHLVGHSLGAALALALADIRGRRIASLTLIAPAGLGPEIDAAALNGIVRASRVESLAPWLRRLTATPQGISDDYARAAMRARADGALRACQADMAQALFPDGVQAFDLRPALQRADFPLQIIWGRSDHIIPHTHAIRAEGEFALHLLAGAGHIPQIECPERVARIIHRMIRSVEPVG
jgi:pyruvate dehydrogenase E2 component (dihydrolipoamide acetyltransferase)